MIRKHFLALGFALLAAGSISAAAEEPSWNYDGRMIDANSTTLEAPLDLTAMVSKGALAAVEEMAQADPPVVVTPESPEPVVVEPVVVEPPDTTISLGPFFDLVAPYLAVGLGLLGMWALVAVARRAGVNLDDSKRAAFQTALNNGAGYLIMMLGDKVKDTEIDVRNPTVARVIRMVQTGAPDAVAKWGVTPEDIADKLTAKIGLATAAPASADLPDPKEPHPGPAYPVV